MFFSRLFAKGVFFFLILALAPALSALPSVHDFLDFNTFRDIINEGEVTRFQYDADQPVLLPETPQAAVLKGEWEKLEPNFSIEGLFFIQQSRRGENQMLTILNIFSSVSTLEGLEYYSASRGEMRLLFEECWRIEDLEDRKRTEDILFTSLPDKAVFHIHQKDLTFGENLSTLSLESSPDSLYMMIRNETPMKYDGWLKLIEPDHFITAALVIPVEEGILYYGTMAARTLGFKFVAKKASRSFYNRMKALFSWFDAIYREIPPSV